MSSSNPQGFPVLSSPIVDQVGRVTVPWTRFFMTLWNRTGGGSGIIPSEDGQEFFLSDDSDLTNAGVQLSLDFGDDNPPVSDLQAMFWPDEAPTQDLVTAVLIQEPAETAARAPLDLPVVGASPFSYVSPRRQAVVVSGGTVTAIEYSRDGATFYNVGLTAGQFVCDTGDVLRVTYAVAPTVFVAAPF